MRLELALRLAIERQELHLCYQPKLNVRSGRVLGAEALLRQTTPQFGAVAPRGMIPVVEDTRLIVPVDAWVRVQACRDASNWHRSGHPGLHVAVTLSARQFQGTESLRHGGFGAARGDTPAALPTTRNH